MVLKCAERLESQFPGKCFRQCYSSLISQCVQQILRTFDGGVFLSSGFVLPFSSTQTSLSIRSHVTFPCLGLPNETGPGLDSGYLRKLFLPQLVFSLQAGRFRQACFFGQRVVTRKIFAVVTISSAPPRATLAARSRSWLWAALLSQGVWVRWITRQRADRISAQDCGEW
jgi:hypothetical protein